MKSVLVTLATDNYLEQAKQLFSSAYFNGAWRGDILLLAFDVSQDKLAWFLERNIQVLAVKPYDSNMERRAQILLSKLDIFKTHFKQWSRIVYLDTDMIVRHPIGDLLKTSGLGGVQGLRKTSIRDRIPKPTHRASTEKRKLYEELSSEYSLNGPGINGGLYVIDTSILSENTYHEIWMLIQKYRSLFNGFDECAVSLYFSRQLMLLPLSYNVFVRLYGMSHNPKKAKGAILHFVGSACTPPWKQGSPYHREWLDNLEQAETMIVNLNSDEETPVWDVNYFKAEEDTLKRKFYQYQIYRRPLSKLSNSLEVFKTLRIRSV